MLKLCDKSICKPFHVIFKSFRTQGIFPSKKKSKCHTNSQKIDRQYVKNYRPVSFLQISCNVFERIILNTMYPYFFKKQDQTENQLGFQLSKYCVNQLLVSTREIFFNFDDTVRSYRDIP